MPLTLLVLGGLVEICRLRTKSAFASSAGLWCFGLGTLGAALSVGTGWALAAHSRHPADEQHLMELHRWGGIVTLAVAAAAFAAQRAWRDSGKPIPVALRRTLSWCAMAVTIVTGHLGALVVWGADWFS